MRKIKEPTPHPEGWPGFQDQLRATTCYLPCIRIDREDRTPVTAFAELCLYPLGHIDICYHRDIYCD